MTAATLTASRPDKSLSKADRIARGLGWFSLGLGLAEIVAPGKLGKALGLEGKETLLRAYGGREMAAGVGALSTNPAPFVWARAAGDIVDLGTLAIGLKGEKDQRRNAMIALAAVAGITVVDFLVAASLTKQNSRGEGAGRDDSDRNGSPEGQSKAHGAASDFETPDDYRAAPAVAEAL
jgi:hypothetical protein